MALLSIIITMEKAQNQSAIIVAMPFVKPAMMPAMVFMAFAVVTTTRRMVQLTVPCKIKTNHHHQKSMGWQLTSQPTSSTCAIKNGPRIPFTTRINTTVCSEILTLNSRVIQSLLSPVEQ